MDELFEHEGYMIFEASYDLVRFYIAAEVALDALGMFVAEAESFYDYMADEMTVSIKPLTVDQVAQLKVHVNPDDWDNGMLCSVPLKQEFLRQLEPLGTKGIAAFLVGYLWQPQGRRQ